MSEGRGGWPFLYLDCFLGVIFRKGSNKMWESLSENIVQFMGQLKKKVGCSKGGGGRGG